MQRKTLITTLLLTSFVISLLFTVRNYVSHKVEEAEKIIDIKFNELSLSDRKEVECLADNIFFESANEPKDGKIAVGLVTMNRVKYGREFGSSVCTVVKQKAHNSQGVMVCQFSWWCNMKAKFMSIHKDKSLSEQQKEMYGEIRDLALYVYLNYDTIRDKTKGALFFHADYVNPHWDYKHTVTIGKHIFYSIND